MSTIETETTPGVLPGSTRRKDQIAVRKGDHRVTIFKKRERIRYAVTTDEGGTLCGALSFEELRRILLKRENADLRDSILGCIRHQRERVERSEGTHLTKQGLALTVLRDLESQIQAMQ